MAFTFANRGLFHLLSTAVTGATDIRMLLFKGTVPTAAAIRDMNYAADVLASAGLTEADFTNYARQDLAGVALAEDDALDKVTLVATAPTIGSAGGATNNTLTGVAYFIETAAGPTDANRVLIGVDVPTPATLVTNGSGVTLPALSVNITGS